MIESISRMHAVLICLAVLCSCSKREPPVDVAQAFAAPKVVAGLPNVLLIGDSISIGYTQRVRENLAGRANVFRPATNCGPTTNGLAELEQWLGNTDWDVIHFNFGLHDMKYLDAQGRNASPTTEGARQQVQIEQYAENLELIAEALKQTGATVIWCQTTPVPSGTKTRISGDARRYNEVAQQVIDQVGGIKTNRLYQFAVTNSEHQIDEDVHYTQSGYRILAQRVSDTIGASLP